MDYRPCDLLYLKSLFWMIDYSGFYLMTITDKQSLTLCISKILVCVSCSMFRTGTASDKGIFSQKLIKFYMAIEFAAILYIHNHIRETGYER